MTAIPEETRRLEATADIGAIAERRRSIRAFTPAPMPRDVLERILTAAGRAPSAFNLQPWRFVVVERPDVKAALFEAARQQPQVASAPAVIVLYTDIAAALQTVADVVHPDLPPERRARTVVSIERFFASKSAEEREAWGAAQGFIALGYLLLAAEAYGYQTSPMQGFDPEAVRSAVGLPAHVRVPALVAIGTGAEEGRPSHRHAPHHLIRFV